MAGKLTDVEFACAAATLKLDKSQLEAAHRVLVNGDTQVRVLEEMNISKQMLSYWVSRVTASHRAQVAAMARYVPAGFEAGIVALPADQLRSVRANSVAELATFRAKELSNG